MNSRFETCVLAGCLLASLGCSLTPHLAAEEPDDQIYAGDVVTITRDGVEIGVADKPSAVLAKGCQVQVTEVRGEWIGGYALVDEKPHTGWVPRKDVRLVVLAPEDGQPMRVPDRPDDPAAVTALEGLGIVLERNADGFAIAADARGKQLSDATMVHFGKLYHLATLQLGGCRVGDDGLKQLTALAGLQELYLDDTVVTDAGLTQIGHLAALEVLALSGSQVVGTSLESLQLLKNLRVLNLAGCPITDNGLAPIHKLSRLEVLALADTDITNEGLKPLKTLMRLRVLNLNNTTVDASGLEHLKTLDQLRMLYVRDTAVTEDDADKLKDTNPSLAIYTY